MNNQLFSFPRPANEPVQSYLKGSPERKALDAALEKLSHEEIEIPLIIGGKEVKTGNMGTVVMPHNHKHVLARYHQAGEKEVEMAIEAALQAKEKWENMPWTERCAINLRVAELLAKKYRALINAATMLGQVKIFIRQKLMPFAKILTFYVLIVSMLLKFIVTNPDKPLTK